MCFKVDSRLTTVTIAGTCSCIMRQSLQLISFLFVKQTTKMAILLLGMQAFTFITATNYDKSKINAKTLHQYK